MSIGARAARNGARALRAERRHSTGLLLADAAHLLELQQRMACIAAVREFPNTQALL